MSAANILLLNQSASLLISNSIFIRNYPLFDALISLTTNSKLNVQGSHFEETFSTSRGGVVFADY